MSIRTLEFDLVRLTAQSSGPNPKEPGGGEPAYTRAEIMALIAEVPHVAFHALMAKYCGDDQSVQTLLDWVHRKNIWEWYDNTENALKRIHTLELRRVAEVALLAWLNPHAPVAQNYETRGAYLGCGGDRFKRVFQRHYNKLLGELDYQEQIGIRVHSQKKYGDHRDLVTEETTRTCISCGAVIQK